MGIFNAWKAAKEVREQGESRFSNPWKDTRLQGETEGADPPEGGAGGRWKPPEGRGGWGR